MTPARLSRGASLLGVVASFAVPVVVFVWLATAGTWDLLRAERLGDFHDVQARSLLEGRLDVPSEAVHIEGIVIEGRTYLYFGPIPALLRVPVFALTDRYDGRLSVISMTVAFTLALASAASVGRRLAATQRSPLVGAGVALLTATSVLLFLGGRAFVYHEAILWGVALSLATYDQVIALHRRFTPGRLAAAAALATAAFLSRASVGLGAAIALGLVCLAMTWPSVRSRNFGRAVSVLAAAALPVLAYSAVNFAKFQSPVSLPLDKQVFSGIDPKRQAALRANDGSLFSLGYVPTTLLQYSRPDAVSLPDIFPWVSFPEPARVVGGAVFDTIDVAASVPVTMPALLALSGVGLVSVARRREFGVAVCAVGAAVGSATALTIGFIAHRYLGDAVPLLVVLGAAGLTALTRVGSAAWRHAALGAVVWLAIVSLWVNLALALQYQRAFAPNIDPALRASLLRWQHELPGGPVHLTGRGGELPAKAARGQLFVIGDCEGLYWSDGAAWHAVERTAHTGQVRGTIAAPSGQVEVEVASVGDARLVAERTADNRGRLVWIYGNGERLMGRAVPVGGNEWALDIVVDRRLGLATGTIDGVLSLDLFYLGIPRDDVALASVVNAEPVPPPRLCPQLDQQPE